MKRIVASFALLLCFVGGVEAADLRLNWTPPTLRSDGSALPASEIANYGVYMSPGEAGALTLRETAAGGANTTHTVRNVPPGRHCVLLRTRDTFTPTPRESGNSNRVCVDVPIAPPNAPATITVTVTVTIE